MAAFVFQQPGESSLLAAIDQVAADADSGGGIFAFASKGGIDALFNRPNIKEMLENDRTFHLIVGIDAITNAEALLCLGDKLTDFPRSLSVSIFYHNNPNSTFHPKFCWFRQDDTVRLITGSGNLTLRGLGQNEDRISGNWEAFSMQTLTGANAIAAQTEIDDWLHTQRDAGTLRSHEDDHVREQAMANGRMRFVRRAVATSPAPVPGTVPVAVAALHAAPVDNVDLGASQVLLRELSANRSGQADVGKNVLEEFFGYAGENTDVLVQHVLLNNTLGTIKQSPLFKNTSQNYRLELPGIKHLEYKVGDDDGRMILVAVKLDQRSFRYAIVPVTHKDYARLSGLLGSIPAPVGAQRRRMREKTETPEALQAAWPNVPSNLLPVALLTPEP